VQLTDDSLAALHTAAADAIVEAVTGRTTGAVRFDAPVPSAQGIFVTVRVHGALRGCIGFVELRDSLPVQLREAARRAATADHRFMPVNASELPALTFDITLLGPLERLESPLDFTIGTHGLVIEASGRRGLLLPQVPLEYGWDREQFLEALCQKALLPAASWNRPDTALFRFEGHVIPGGALEGGAR
jgi:AmmeMemoRadiSam system protein A